jgi:hypothetical protein
MKYFGGTWLQDLLVDTIEQSDPGDTIAVATDLWNTMQLHGAKALNALATEHRVHLVVGVLTNGV